MESLIYVNDIMYYINHFLTLKEKLNFRLVNKYVSKVEKNLIFLHIGEIISNKIGLSNRESDALILREIPLEMTKEILHFLETPFFESQLKLKYYPRLSFGLLLRISRLSREDCIKNLKTKMLFRDVQLKRKYKTKCSLLKKYFPQTYAILLD